MTEFLQAVHPWIGYAVFLVVLVVTFVGFGRAKDAREFSRGPYAISMVLLDVQVTLGILLYVVGGYWNDVPEIAYIHPALALLALAVGHALLGRARRIQMAVDAHRTAARGLLFATVLVLLSIGVASAPPFL